jgi:hypothetical protein
MDEHHRDFAMTKAAEVTNQDSSQYIQDWNTHVDYFFGAVSIRTSPFDLYMETQNDEFALGVQHGHEDFCEFTG